MATPIPQGAFLATPYAVPLGNAVTGKLDSSWVVGSGSAIGGSIASTQVAFGSGVNTIAGSANLTWSGTVLTVNGGITGNGALLFTTDNTYDIGALLSSRPRDLYLGRNALIAGNVGISGNFSVTGTSNNSLAGNLIWTADNTYDIGASGATRPRDLFLGRNAVIGGTTSFGGNIVSNLLFTDNTYDIGASGATRPRDLYVGRNTLIYGTVSALGQVHNLGNGSVVSADTSLAINGKAGFAKVLFFQTGGLGRWSFNSNSDAEGGSNAGSNFVIFSLSDAGGFLRNDVVINRQFGGMTLANGLTVNGNVIWTTDNASDIGASGANRPRSIFLSANITAAGQTHTFGAGSAVAADTNLILNGKAGNSKVVYFQSAGVSRWAFLSNQDAESGTNAGSNFVIFSLDDAGGFLRNDLFINRASGAVTMTGSLAVSGAFGCNTKGAQTAFASGGALAAYSAGANGLSTGADMSALVTLVGNIRTALVNNGIMS